MTFRIHTFIISFLTLFGLYFYLIFSFYYQKQEEDRANIILKNLKSNLSELSYTISKELNRKNQIVAYRSTFDRVVANNDFINSILIFDDEKLLLTTDPDIKRLDTLSGNYAFNTSYENLLKNLYIKTDINFYENKIPKTLLLFFVLETDEIHSHFIKNKINFILFFVILPLIAFTIMFLLLKKYISKPLEKLRQYAYYNNEVPKSFTIKELEVIRHSMVDTFSRLENEKKELYLMARTDSLSGLANRNSLNEFLERLIPISKRNEKEFAFLFLDMDNFKTINDSLGHNIGDELLQNISKKINKILRPTDFVARIGGDEFAIIIQDYKNYVELSSIVDRVQKYISKPWLIQTNPLNISCSIGIALYPKNGTSIVSLMKNADIAMYEAKKLGRNQYHFYTEELNDSVQKIISLTKDMKEALEKNQYELYYQPKVDIKTSKIVGAEALIRWNDPKKGLISPNDFIPLAEENDFIKELGKWIITEAISQYVKWRKENIDITIAINISAKQLDEHNFAENLISLLNKHQIKHSKIDIEITEYMFLKQTSQTNSNLQKLHNAGINISLDDFGTGYSSLSYLKKFPINNLKIDKSFLDDYNSEKGSIFLETIIKMGQMLNMKVIAEGVEDEKQLNYLKEISCDLYQGYYFSKPISAIEFEKLYFRIMS